MASEEQNNIPEVTSELVEGL